MKAEIYNDKEDKTIRRFVKKDSAIWCPKNESHWKKNPYVEICLEDVIKKHHVVIIKIPFKELKTLIKIK